MKGLGCKLRSAPHKVASFGAIHPVLGIGAAQVPTYATSSNLAPHCIYRLDQGRSKGCGGHAPAVWILIAASIAGIDLGFVGPPSQRHIYGAARAREAPGTAPLDDSGVEPADPIFAITEVGVRAMDHGPVPTPDGRMSDVTTAADLVHVGGLPNVGLRPTASELATSMRDLIIGAYVIDPLDPNFLALLAATLTAEKPIAIALFVDSAFELWGDQGKTAPLQGAPNFADPKAGGHYVAIVGHQVQPDGSFAFLILNSWGALWGCPPPSGGLPGLIWVSGGWLVASATEAYGIDLAVKVAA